MFNASRNIHIGEILHTNYIEHSDHSAESLEQELGFPVQEVVRQRRPIYEAEAEKLSEFFGTPKRFWIQLHKRYYAEKQREADLRSRLE